MFDCCSNFEGNSRMQGWHLAKKIWKFRSELKWKSNFLDNPFITCRLLPELVSFPVGKTAAEISFPPATYSVSSLSSAENNNGKYKCKWWARSRSVGLLILKKPLPNGLFWRIVSTLDFFWKREYVGMEVIWLLRSNHKEHFSFFDYSTSRFFFPFIWKC